MRKIILPLTFLLSDNAVSPQYHRDDGDFDAFNRLSSLRLQAA